ncbi:dihydrodipicolinate synthase family protein [Phaeobacter sp. HF9A]|uniref:dihydrodipicolinate synthase family protein n=1 Tax=Phaeobacter sp. HF9A TaxID=2721561 RepID=UPI00143165DE|nr:dihydrodipicolinate synthase family protein [Phaeobacter sp. HF9A]NIZ15054.1 dihydrodipicolinate synthase family protein [Phaeobacter sp. HF9A]
MFGISAALLTPFQANGEIDGARLGHHAKSLLDRGLRGVTLFGTTGEGASISAQERALGIQALLEAGCAAESITLGICATSLGDADHQVAEGLGFGITSFLLLPPYYFKPLDEEGLFDWHMELFRRVDPKARFILYNIPQLSGVPLSAALVGRLAAAAPNRVQAIKDSSGSWESAEAFLALGTVTVLIGDERLLHRAVALGAGGAISGVANLYPERMAQIVATATEDAALSAEVTRIVSMPVIPALKVLIAQQTGDAAWDHLRLPLRALDATDRARLLQETKAEA